MRTGSIAAILLGLAALSAPAAAQHHVKLEDLPEEVRRQIPPGGVLLGPARSDGYTVYDEPRPTVAEAPTGEVALEPDAILFEQKLLVPRAVRRSDGPVRVGAPFHVELAAGTLFTLVRQQGEERHCLRRKPNESYSPPEDEKGEIYPGLCLLDKDGDGAFEAALMWPYRPDRARPRILPIAPLKLGPVDLAGDWTSPYHIAARRLRILSVGDEGIELGAEDSIGDTLSAAPARWYPAPIPAVRLPLRPGAEARIAGIVVRIGGGAGRWTALAEGAFEPWVELREDRTGFTSGSLRIEPRLH